jgi:hypothetical protein
LLTALEHQLATSPNEPRAVRHIEGAGGVIGGELAERMAGSRPNVRADALSHRRPDGRAVGEQRGLRVMRERERLPGAVEAQGAQRLTEGGIHRGEGLARSRERVYEIPGHSRLLRSLSRE